MIKINIIWIIVLFSSFNLLGQSFKADLEKMYANYSGADDFQLDVKIEITQGGKAANKFNKKAFMIKNGSKFLSGYEQTEILLTETYILMINHEQKNLVYRTVTSREWKELQKSTLSMNLDSVFSQCDSVKYIGDGEAKCGYRIYSKNQMISQTDFLLDCNTKKIEKLVYEYNTKFTNQPYHTEITYLHQKISDAAMAKLASVEKMIVKSGGKMELNQGYKQYQLTIVNDED